MPRSVTDNVIDHFLEVSSKIYAQERVMLDENGFTDLTLNEVRIIAQIKRLNKPTMGQIAGKLSLSLGTLTTAVIKIEQKGYLNREQSKKDKRVYIPKLTKKGHLAADRYNAFFNDLILACNTIFKRDEMHVMKRWLDFLYQYETKKKGESDEK
ncbi:MAG: MarR family winged helix-turn-helix transcriptional regulator [Culicoidibacterales bacterium]